MKSFARTLVGEEARVELHDSLALTGAEVRVSILYLQEHAYHLCIRTRTMRRSMESLQVQAKPL